MDFTLRFEEIPYFHKRSRKQFGEEIFPAEDDRDLLRNKSYKDPLWNRFIRFILYKNKKNNNDDVSSTVSMCVLLLHVVMCCALLYFYIISKYNNKSSEHYIQAKEYHSLILIT